ncbi:transposase [Pseudobacteriovorax antillogorgiicola]|uniref:REP element-mobilizing transposase RayT n=1 Tax=Pseudobacteriovorax antillogorgiicola TaxID=1513793 RepID=A0A1Y6CYC2_9BACT|nr:transposase [Pseudobacteriovorax antillogorgiicola]SMF85271.1 REP element-mobilizing transposase RayT [Pseudobacteriovorax antillogorgiicola]
MGRARQDIVKPSSLLHVTFRCHNREFYFHSPEMKKRVYQILLKYRETFNVHIFDWVIMSNHVHLLVYSPDRETLSRYLHSTNLAIAKVINQAFKRRGQAIEDRFKSPVIEDESYALNTVGYIWLNPVRAKLVDPQNAQNYRYSSLFFKWRGLDDPLVSDDSVLGELLGISLLHGRSVQEFARYWLEVVLNRISGYISEVFENLHSIGSYDFWKIRRLIPRLSSA